MRTLLMLCLGILIVLTGCILGPFVGPSEQERPVQVVLNNSADETQTFEVWVVEVPSTATTRLNDSRTGNYTIGQGLRSHSSGDAGFWVAIELADSARLHGRFVLEPDEEHRSRIEKFPRNFAVVVVLYQDPNVSGWWASANCDDQTLVGFKVHTRPSKYGDAWAGYECR